MFCYNQAFFSIKKNLVVEKKIELKLCFKTRVELKLNSFKLFFGQAFFDIKKNLALSNRKKLSFNLALFIFQRKV